MVCDITTTTLPHSGKTRCASSSADELDDWGRSSVPPATGRNYHPLIRRSTPLDHASLTASYDPFGDVPLDTGASKRSVNSKPMDSKQMRIDIDLGSPLLPLT